MTTVNQRLILVKQKIVAVLDEYESEIGFAICVAKAYAERTGGVLGPNDVIDPEDEICAYALMRESSKVMQ